MPRILPAGAGKIGGTITVMLRETSAWGLKVIDAYADAMHDVAAVGIVYEADDVTNAGERRQILKGVIAVISVLPYDLNGPLVRSQSPRHW